MIKKFAKHGNSVAIIVDKPLLKMLKMTKDSSFELILENGDLIIRPVRAKKKALSKKERLALVEQVADEVMDKYEEAFKKLAK